jgi:hypothetical protein
MARILIDVFTLHEQTNPDRITSQSLDDLVTVRDRPPFYALGMIEYRVIVRCQRCGVPVHTWNWHNGPVICKPGCPGLVIADLPAFLCNDDNQFLDPKPGDRADREPSFGNVDCGAVIDDEPPDLAGAVDLDPESARAATDGADRDRSRDGHKPGGLDRGGKIIKQACETCGATVNVCTLYGVSVVLFHRGESGEVCEAIKEQANG